MRILKAILAKLHSPARSGPKQRRPLRTRGFAAAAPLALVAALGVMAVSASAASATTLSAGGVALLPGEQVTAFGSNVVTKTGVGNLECNEVTLSGEVGANNAEPATVINGGGTATNNGSAICPTSNPNATVQVTSIEVGPIKFYADGHDTSPLKFTYTLFIAEPPLTMHCFLEGEAFTEFPLNVPLTGETGAADHINGEKSPLTGGGISEEDTLCPTTGSIEGDLGVSSGGNPVTIS